MQKRMYHTSLQVYPSAFYLAKDKKKKKAGATKGLADSGAERPSTRRPVKSGDRSMAIALSFPLTASAAVTAFHVRRRFFFRRTLFLFETLLNFFVAGRVLL